MRVLERIGLFWSPPDSRPRAAIEQDIHDELESHIALRTDALVEEGVAPDEARRRAESAFGDRQRIFAACRRTQLRERIMLQRINFTVLLAVLAAFGWSLWRAEALHDRTAGAFGDVRGELQALRADVAAGRRAATLRMPEFPALELAAPAGHTDVLTSDWGSTPVAAGGAQVHVLGNVSRPGSIPWSSGMTVVTAIAACGDFEEFASRGDVRILRRGKSIGPIDVTAILEGREKDVELKRDDRLYVPETFF